MVMKSFRFRHCIIEGGKIQYLNLHMHIIFEKKKIFISKWILYYICGIFSLNLKILEKNSETTYISVF